MTEFLSLLAKVNLVMAGAILMVALLRHPIRTAFHVSTAYALWLLVPAAAMAGLLPPRIVSMAVQANLSAIPLSVPARLPGASFQDTPLDWSIILFLTWLAGAGAMGIILVWQQHRFNQSEKAGLAGPAVTGFWQPRIVLPRNFAAAFNEQERAAIMAHEEAHLARQDARINALVAALRCVSWFNPLVHLGAAWLREDQELACDAAALKQVARLDYANALLKSQMNDLALPLGCGWPGREHPLTERIALLQRRQPGRVRKVAGIGTVASLTCLASLGAWAAQPARMQADCPKGTGFCGKYLYAQRAGSTGPAFFLSLESERRPDQVVMHYPYGMARADSAHMDLMTDKARPKIIVLTGNVKVAQGLNFLTGNKLVFDARTGALDLDGRQMPSGMPKYVPCTKDCRRFEQ